MKKILLFCLCITTGIVSAAANNNAANTSDNTVFVYQFLFSAKLAIRNRDFVEAERLIEIAIAILLRRPVEEKKIKEVAKEKKQL